MKNVKCKKIVSIITAFLYFALIVSETIYAKSWNAFLPLKSNELYALADKCIICAGYEKFKIVGKKKTKIYGKEGK